MARDEILGSDWDNIGYEVVDGNDCDILIYGWYRSDNYGDDMFKNAFHVLFPKMGLKFTKNLEDFKTVNYKYAIFGGGNILSQGVADIQEHIKTPYEFWSISVPEQELKFIKKPKRIVVRDHESFKNLLQLPGNSLYANAPDMVSVLHRWYCDVPYYKRTHIAFAHNFNTVPSYACPHSKHTEYNRYVCETARYLDETNHWFQPISLQATPTYNDDIVAHAIHGMRRKRHSVCAPKHWKAAPPYRPVVNALSDIGLYKGIVTARYHAAIVAILTETPVLCIDFHSKMKSLADDMGLFSINYYEYSKAALARGVECMMGETEDPEMLAMRKKRFIRESEVYHEFARQIMDEIRSTGR